MGYQPQAPPYANHMASPRNNSMAPLMQDNGGVGVHNYSDRKRQGSYKSVKQSSSSRSPYDNVAILKLTSVNLEKHNKLFPPKRKQVKEVMLTKVILSNCVVAY